MNHLNYDDGQSLGTLCFRVRIPELEATGLPNIDNDLPGYVVS